MTLPEFPEQASGNAVAQDAAARQPPLKFEPTLLPRLRAAHAALNARFGEIAAAIDRDPAATARMIEECARQFTAIRHIETIWVYPMLARAVESDSGARAQLAELRLIGLILARRMLRCFDDSQQALRVGVYVAEAVAQVTAALARYSRHSDNAIYPLYELIGEPRPNAQVA